MTGMVADMEPDAARMKKAAGEGYATATDLADWLVRTLKMPFREAHHVTGRIVAKAAGAGRRRCTGCRSPTCRRSSRESPRTCFRVLSVDRSVESRTSYRRHRAEKRARAGEEMAAQARKRAILTSP